MKNRKFFYIGILLVFGLLITTPILGVSGKLYDCPSTQPGDTKVLKVTTVNKYGLTQIFGSDWKADLNNSFGGAAATKGAKLKTIVQGIDTDATLNLTFSGLQEVKACNITVDYWNFTSGELLEEDKGTTQTYVIKDPVNLTNYVQTWRNVLAATYPWVFSAGNVTVPWASDATYGGFLGQLAVPPEDYLNEITWEENWTSSGKKIIHDVHSGYSVGENVYQDNCTETWTFYDNGALIGYKLVNSTGTTVYEFQFQLPGAPEIPGYSMPIVLGLTALALVGVIVITRRKK